ncbi:MAG: type VII secretion protein EsaA [Bacillus sp. (in: firmicutes)]
MGTKHLLSLGAKIIIILLLPVMFFSYVGHDPMKQSVSNSRSIAIVNEDDGAEYQGDDLFLGRTVAGILGKDSPYSWSVVNRNTAESGLQKKQYDAIIYLPTNFTKSILTFNEDTPVKASISYKIQPSLNAENAEKVQKELEVAKNSINTRVSRVYWGYVAESMDDIKQKFNSVVEKEIAFQDTMYNFYNPSSQSLAGEIENQREMIQSVFSVTDSASEASGQSIQQIDATKAQFQTFLDAVDQYREYQENQVKLMDQTNQENMRLLQESVNSYNTVIKEGVDLVNAKNYENIPGFAERANELSQTVSSMKNSLQESQTAIDNMEINLEPSLIDQQANNILNQHRKDIQSFAGNSVINFRDYRIEAYTKALNSLQDEILAARNGLTEGTPGEDEGETPIEEPALPELPGWEPDLASAQNSLNELKEAVKAMPEEEQEKMTAPIANLEASLASLPERLQEQTNAVYGQWADSVKAAVMEAIRANMDDLKGRGKQAAERMAERIRAEIKELENATLASEALKGDDARKSALSEAFARNIASSNVEELMAYHQFLSAFASEITQKPGADREKIEEIINDSIIDDEIQGIIRGAFKEVKSKTEVEYKLGIDKTLNKFGGDFDAYTANLQNSLLTFKAVYADVHSQIMTNLETVRTQTAGITENLTEATQAPIVEQAPIENLNGEFAVAAQDGTLAAVQGVSSVVDSLAEQQDSIIGYTSDLQGKVSSVQQQADDLNDRWKVNVDTSTRIQQDVNGLLNNTIVDGQQNPFMYDYLANPVKISGNEFVKQTAPTPPVLMLVVILLSSILIGYFLHHFSGANMMLHIPLFLLITLITGLIISMYGLRIYPMHDTQAVKWSILTVMLLITCTSLVRLAFFVGPFIGSLLTVALIIYFTTPLMDLVLPNFSIEHPVANVMLAIQQGNSEGYVTSIVVLSVLPAIFSLIPYIAQMRSADESQEASHEA